MPISIKVEDFKEEIISEYLDEKGLLNKILNYCYQNVTQTKILKYIDLYDDTVLNNLQVKDFILDIKFLMEQNYFVDQQSRELLAELIKLALLTLEEPHQYLKFYGD